MLLTLIVWGRQIDFLYSKWLGNAAMALWLSFVGIALYQRKIILKSASNAPARIGTRVISLDSRRMRIDHPGFFTEMQWACFVEAIDLKDGLLILTSDVEGHPVPAASLPESMSRDELKEQINLWITQSRQNQGQVCRF
jgi:hypothetical protein